MKDYTKYDFAAIVGAEVEVNIRFFPRHKGKVLCRWEYEGKPYLTILVCEPNGSHLCDIPVDEIVPGSLTAKIKVEDMSVKQLKRFIDSSSSWYEIVMIAEDGVHHSILEMCDEPTDDMPVKSFTDYIDCTEWGWKHE